MTPSMLLEHLDQGRPWPFSPGEVGGNDLTAAYRLALEVRKLRIARGERPAGYKVGFTNRTIWTRYNVFAPIWGTVWDSTLRYCEGEGEISLSGTCQPRIEPEAVFGMRATPKQDATLDDLFDAVEWIAPGFEIVQSHLPDWKFTATDTVADSALHARLLVGTRIPVRQLAATATELNRLLTNAQTALYKNGQLVEQGNAVNVLDGPLHALLHFLNELRHSPGQLDLQDGDVVTTGTWTDAWSIKPGETWTARFSEPLAALSVSLT